MLIPAARGRPKRRFTRYESNPSIGQESNPSARAANMKFCAAKAVVLCAHMRIWPAWIGSRGVGFLIPRNVNQVHLNGLNRLQGPWV